MATWTLAEIRTKVRNVTGRLTPGELDNTLLDDYINKYYTLTFPAELKLEKKHTFYEFATLANTTWYTLPNTTYTNLEPPATIDNLHLYYYQNPATFYNQNPHNVSRQVIGIGDGTDPNFSGTASTLNIMPGSIVIGDSLETFRDINQTWTTSNVNITGSAGGTAVVNYVTGSVSGSFAANVPDGENISLSYIVMTTGRPTAVLNYNNQLQFYPTPDQSYSFKIQAYAVVTELTDATDRPELDEWGPCIAYGAARDIVADNGEMDAYQEITALYKEQLAYVLKRTNQNLLNTRVAPNF